jgi:anti-sigma B factor antagonist
VGLQIEVRQAGAVTLLVLQGRATIGAGNDALVGKLREVVDGGAQKVLVNLEGVSQIDSSGISTLVRNYVTLGKKGGTLKLLKPTGRVKEVLDVTRLTSCIPSFDDEAKAVASFK